jgi:hypothetical protein
MNSDVSSEQKPVPYSRLWVVVSVAVLGVGFTVLLMGLLFAAETYDFMKRAVNTNGQVVAYEAGSRSLYPVVEFLDQQGNVRRFVGKVGSRKTGPKIGEVVVVVFDPTAKDPASNARLSKQAWAIPAATSLLGLVLFGLGLWWLRRPKSAIEVAPNPSVKGTSCGKPQAAPYVER